MGSEFLALLSSGPTRLSSRDVVQGMAEFGERFVDPLSDPVDSAQRFVLGKQRVPRGKGEVLREKIPFRCGECLTCAGSGRGPPSGGSDTLSSHSVAGSSIGIDAGSAWVWTWNSNSMNSMSIRPRCALHRLSEHVFCTLDDGGFPIRHGPGGVLHRGSTSR